MSHCLRALDLDLIGELLEQDIARIYPPDQAYVCLHQFRDFSIRQSPFIGSLLLV